MLGWLLLAAALAQSAVIAWLQFDQWRWDHPPYAARHRLEVR